MTKRTLVWIGLSVLLTACATPYQERGLRGGVTATPLNESVYEIRASGNYVTSGDQIKDFVLLKSAEICRDNSFTHFIPLNQSDTSQTTTIQNPYYTNCSGLKCLTTGGGSTSMYAPGADMRIKLFGGNDEIPDSAFSCAVIYNTLAPKYIK